MQLIIQIRLALAVTISRLITTLVRGLGLGAASVFPGDIVRRIYPHLLPLLFKQVKKGIILVVGTNGKTTTSLLLRTILEKTSDKIAHNIAGANLINGITTTLLENTNLFGKLSADYAILEVDENILPLLLKDCTPQYILALNLFRDQLDRYGEVDTISQRWQEAISPLPTDTKVIINADDPTLNYLGKNLDKTVKFFGLNEPELYLDEIPHAVDSIYCPSCGTPLQYEGVYLSHLGDYICPSCGFEKSKTDINSAEWGQILIGVYNKYNTLAAGLLAQEIGIEKEIIFDSIKNFRAAFGRAEELEIKGKKVRILLSKNPVGMNETIRAVNDIKKQGKASTSLMILNDRIPDGTDVSWIWDVDMEKLAQAGGKIIVTGDRIYDMALRLNYCNQDIENPPFQLIIKEDLSEAIETALEECPKDETLHILPTYSAMLEVRGILTGKKIL